jgi:hypothetical protein
MSISCQQTRAKDSQDGAPAQQATVHLRLKNLLAYCSISTKSFICAGSMVTKAENTNGWCG